MQPPRRAGKSFQARLGRARAGPEVPAGSWGGGAAGARFLPGPAPTQAGPGAASRARLRRPQSSAVRLGRRAAVAPPRRAPLAPARAPSESVCRAHALASLPPLPPPSCSSRGAGHSLGFLPPRSSSPFPSRQRRRRRRARRRRRRRGELLGCRCASPAGAGVQLGCPSVLPCRPALRDPRLCSLLSEAGGAPSSFPPPLHSDLGAAALPDSCPSDPDRQGVPQGRSAAEKTRQTGPCGA